ncbi:serine protease, partial [Dawidia soli]
MTPHFKNNYHNSIVQVCTSGGMPQGCGVIVSEDLVVTCSHVVVRVLQHNAEAQSTGQPDPDPDSVWIRRPFVDGLLAQPREVRILHCIPHNTTSEIADIAILQLKGERFSLHTGDAIASFTLGVVPLYTNVMALGFPTDAARTSDNSATAHYVIRDHTPFHWYHAVAEAAVGHEIRAGFSGSPVMDEGSGELIGIISEADATRRTATIIPTACLREVYPFPVSTSHTSVTPDTPDQTDVPVPDLYKPGIRLLLDMFAPRLHHFLTCRLGLLEKPRELETLHRYSAHNRAAWEDELSQKTYLPPPAKEIGHTASCYDDPNMKAIHVPIQQAIKEIAGISSGGDSSTAQISALSKQTRRVRNLVRRIQYSQKPLIVLGEPGSGKSLTLKQAAIAFSKLNQGRIFPTVCIFINLGKWKPVAKPDVLHVEQLVRSNVPAAIVSWLPQLADQRRLIILFDGLDEMSRVQYTEHTKALSSYATVNEGKIKTLFSCRIADFSPTFRHHRLVLLPFTKKHIQTYLERKFANIPLTLRAGTFTMRQLTQKLDDENLPLQAHNPFSLWLLCLYLGQKGKFPGSRVELLLYSFEYQFDRKKSEHEGLPFPDRKKSFDAWGLLAYTITRRNKGTDIERHELRGLFGPETDSIVSTGALAGVLHRTLENDLPLVRFTHHRAQEFFTAYH